MREILVQGSGGLGSCGRRFVKQKIDLWQRRQAFLDPDFAHVAHQRAAAKHGHRHSREGRRLQPADAIADAGDTPSQA
jgi:hypothetical protein